MTCQVDPMAALRDEERVVAFEHPRTLANRALRRSVQLAFFQEDAVRLAIRHFLAHPRFAALAILTFALGIGANTAMFTVVHGLLLEPLPYEDPNRLVAVAPDNFVSNTDLTYWRTRFPQLASVDAFSPGWGVTLTGAGDPVRLTAAKISAGLFSTLGVAPAIGRAFDPTANAPGQTRVAILSHELWQTRFASDPSIVGKSILLDDAPFAVAGVMPPGFEFYNTTTDLWLPLAFGAGSMEAGRFSLLFARVASGVSVEQAQRDFVAALPQMRRELGYASDMLREGRIVPLHEVIVGPIRPSLLVLFAAVGLILLIAAANLATLLLTRAVGRAREVAVQRALGATRGRVVAQAVGESLLLAILGGAVGVLIAHLTIPIVIALVPADTPRVGHIAVDSAVLLVALGFTVLAGLLSGLVPALTGSRDNLMLLIRSASSEAPRGRRTRSALVVAEVALALMLTAGAALTTQTLWKLRHADAGFDGESVMTLRLQVTSARYRAPQQVSAFYTELIEKIGAVPGVRSVGAVQHLPLTGFSWSTPISIDGSEARDASPPMAGWRVVTPGYFEAMRIPLLAGRSFETGDRRGGLAVAIVNEVFARRFFGDVSEAVGRQIRTGSRGETQTIVGVVGAVRHASLDRPASVELYQPHAQASLPMMMIAVRADGDPANLATALRSAVWSIDRGVPIARLEPMDAIVAQSVGRPRLLMVLLLAFAAIGLALGLIGVYGVVACAVAERQREFGIRIALGANRRDVLGLVLGQGLRYALVGLAIGIPSGIGLARMMRRVLYGVGPADPLAFTIAAAGVTVAVLAASLPAARRASRVDPVTALKSI